MWGLGGARMLPGTDCLSCHVEGGPAAPLSVGGTVFRTNLCPEPVEGAVVRVADRLGVTLELVSNEVGNFHATEPLALPLSVSVEADGVLRVMSSPAAGSCGACHDGGVEGAVWVWSGTGANAE